MLVVAGVELLHRSIDRIIDPSTSTASWFIIALVILTLIIKELMARFSYMLAEKIDSTALKADAMHHRTDVFATALVVVALVATRFGYMRIDGIMGILVCLIIFYSAYIIAKEAIDPLLGQSPSKEQISSIDRLARSHKAVLGIHDIMCHRYGQNSIISLHIEVEDKESAFKLHELAEDIEDEIAQEMSAKVVVHVDPINREHPLYEPINKTIQEIVSSDKRIHAFHDLRIAGCGMNRCNILFDIVLECDVDEQKAHSVARSAQSKLKHRFPKCKAFIRAEAYNP